MSRWDGAYSSAILSLAKELSKSNRVFYIDHPFTWKDFITNYNQEEIRNRKQALLFGRNIYKKVDGFPDNFTAVTPKAVLPINWLPKGNLYDLFSGVNDHIFFSTVRKVINDHKVKHFLFFNSFDPFFGREIPKDMQPELCIYQSRDDISQARHSAKHGVRLEQEQVKQADVVLVTSKELKRTMSRYSENVYLLPNAADVGLFRKANENNLERPEEIAQVQGKIIGYTGNISRSRVDFPLLKQIAESNRDKTLLMVGPVDSDDYKKYGLDKMPNVIFTWSKDITKLPAYLRYMDCAIIPFQCNTLTKSIYPLKINEYLAAGKPVVSTDFSEDINDFQDVAYIARDHEEFLALINKSMEEDGREAHAKRLATAEKNSWPGRVDLFWEIIDKHLHNGGNRPNY